MSATVCNLRWYGAKRALVLFVVAAVALSSAVSVLVAPSRRAQAATLATVNFQARLMTNTGAIAPDNDYNVEFKLYDTASTGATAQGICTGNCKWVETRTSTDKVHIANGYLTVNLGSVTAFGTSINWDQDLWITMNIGGTGTPSWDGEMSPRLKMTAVPYAFRAGALSGGSGANTTILDAGTPSGTNILHLPVESGTLCVQGAVSCGFAAGTAASYIQNQNAASQTAANFWVAGTGRADTALQAPVFDAGSAVGLAIGGGNATSITIGKTTANNNTLIVGTTTIKPSTTAGDASTAFLVQNANAQTLLAVDTSTATVGVGATGSLALASNINIGTTSANNTQTITIGSTGNASNKVSITAGTTATGTGAVSIQAASGGLITIGTTNNNPITVGGTSSTVTVQGTAKLGTLGASTTAAVAVCRDSSTTNLIACGSGGTGAPFLQGGNSFGAAGPGVLGTNDSNSLQIQTNGVVRGTFDTSNALYLGNGVTAATPNAFTVAGTGSVTAGTAGATLTLQGGAGASATTGSAGGGLTIAGGNAAGSGNNAGGNVVLQGGNKTNTGAAGKVLVKNAADSTTAFQVQNAAGTSTIVDVDTSSGFLGVGTAAPSRQLHVAVANALVNALPILIEQTSTGDTGIEFKTSSKNFYAGVDNTDGQFKISSLAGANGTFTQGNTTQETASDDSNISGEQAYRVTATGSGTVSSMSVYITTLDATPANRTIQFGIYTDQTTGCANSNPCPATLLGSSTAQTAVVGWNTFSISGVTINSGTTYWLAMSENGNNRYAEAISGGTVAYHLTTGYPLTNPFAQNFANGTVKPSFYMTVTTNGTSDYFGGTPLFRLSDTGAAVFQNVSNAATAFQVQNAAGTTLLGVDTQGSAVNIGAVAAVATATTVNLATSSGATQIVNIGGVAAGGAAAGTLINIQGGTTANTAVTIGTSGAGGITIDSGTTGAIKIGNGAGAKTVTLGSTNTTSSTIIQAGTNNLIFNTSGTVRGVFDTSNNFYLGNGVSAAAPNNFTLQGTASTTTAVAGGSLTVQGGNATVGNANGGTLTLSGGTGFGTGVKGLVVLSTPTFATASTQICGSNCTITQANVDGNGAVIINASAGSLTASLPDPAITTAGRIVYVTAANGSNDFTLSVNGGGTGNLIAMRQNTTATMIWNGSDWTAAGASSSTTLQAAYDNTLTSAGGAELVLSNTANANGLTIRDSSTNPVNATLLEVQNKTAANIFSVNSSVTDYANNGGAESVFGTEWAATGTATVTRNTNATYVAGGTGSVSIAPTAATSGAKNVLTTTLTPNLRYNVSFAAKLTSGSATFNDLSVYYSVDGSASSVACSNYSTQTVNASVWTKINCTFTTPASGLTATNAVFIRQTASATRTFYVDNFSVTVSADLNYATDGGVDDNTNFTTNWTAVASSTVTRSTTVGNDTSDSAQVVTAGANQGVRNKLSINPFTSTLYRISAYTAATTGGFTTFTVRYSRDGGTNFTACADYNTQTVAASTSSFTQITCYITTDGTAATSPYIYFTQTDATGRTWYVDTFSMTLSNNTVPNVQIGGGVNGGPLTLFTLDRGASAPIASNNDALLGSMYYDTTLGKLQCYEADGWGACGSSPDNIITISPEYTNAVMHGTGIGTMTSDICSDALNINDGSSSQPTICGTNETYNFYKWTSPQASPQTYSMYVTYQLPSSFKTFSSGQTSLMGRTDSSNATVQYTVYRNDTASGLVQCGSTVAVSTGSVSSWQTGVASGAADPSTCGFSGGDSIVFKIDVVASSNASSYVGNLNFTFTNQ